MPEIGSILETFRILEQRRVLRAVLGRAALVIVGCILLGCSPRTRWVPPFSDMALQQRDLVECAALAGQAAQGQGAFFSDRAFRAGYEGALREDYLARCLVSRGWWVEAL